MLTVLDLTLLLVIGVLDYRTGTEFSFAAFYLIPVAIASWYINRQAGIWFSLLCASIWTMGELAGGRSYTHFYAFYWNLLARLTVLMTLSLLLFTLRSRLEKELETATRDFLTGLPNNHLFHSAIAAEINRPFGIIPLTLVYVDVDGLELINRRFGPSAGDQILCAIAEVIKTHAPRKDLIGRLRGAVFGVLLPKTDAVSARLTLEKLQSDLSEQRRKYGQPITFVISAITYLKSPQTLSELIHEAKRQMDRIKDKRGKDYLEIEAVDTPSSTT